MNALFSFSLLCISTNLYVMDWINDIKQRCTIYYVNPALQIYSLEADDACVKDRRYTFYVSQTLPVYPVKAMTSDNFNENDIEPKNECANFPNPQFWNERGTIRISDDINYTNDTFWQVYDTRTLSNQCKFKFDGINRQGISVLCLVDQKEKNNTAESKFYIFNRLSTRGNYGSTDYYKKTRQGHCQDDIQRNGYVNALVLENNRNRIVYSISKSPNNNTLYIEDILSNTDNHYVLATICKDHTLPLFKKIIPLGNTHSGQQNQLSDVYLALIPTGQLYTFWFDKNNKIHHAQQKCDLNFIDIATDITYQSQSGLCPKIALADNRGKLFITDLTQKGNPILHCVYTIKQENLPNFSRLTYYDGICGIIYHNGTNNLAAGKYEEIYDNFSLISAANLFKLLLATPTNPDYNQDDNKNTIVSLKNNYNLLRLENLPPYQDKKAKEEETFKTNLSLWEKCKNPLFFCLIIAIIISKYCYAK